MSHTKASDYQGGAELHSVLILPFLSTLPVHLNLAPTGYLSPAGQYKPWLTADQDSKH